MARHEILEYLYRQEPDGIVGGEYIIIEVQQHFSDWCYDLAEELEIMEFTRGENSHLPKR